MEKILGRWNGTWEKYHEFFGALTLAEKFFLSMGFAFMTGLSAQFCFRLPFTPVPFTGQVFTVLLAGILLGKEFGAISQLAYILGGAAGIGWFSFSGSAFLGTTTGYITGFAAAAYIIGLMCEKDGSCAGRIRAMLAGITTILLMGTLWLSFYLRIPVSRAFLAGFLPFLPFDIIKAFIAGTLAGSILRSSRETR